MVYGRSVDPGVLEVMARRTVAGTDLGLHWQGSDLFLSVLWHNHDEPTPRILASRFVTPETAEGLRFLADTLDSAFEGVPR